jgi:hypothetical protein
VRSDLFGTKSVGWDTVAALEFRPKAPLAGMQQPNTLVRVKGEPVPGTLLAVTAEKIVLDSPLGEVAIPRADAVRYVADNRRTPQSAHADEVSLSDGSVLHGRLHPGADGLQLEHAVLGRLTVPAGSLRSLVRRSNAVIDLTWLAPQSATTAPLVSAAKPPARLRAVRGDAAETGPVRFIKGLRIEPSTVVHYELPAADGRARLLRATVQSVDGARGDTRLRVRIGQAIVLEREVAAGGKPEVISVELPAGDELTIEVEFGPRLRFPCGVVLGDPHVVTVRR